nr:MAG TPA: hypothetical protein [Caudoviricetes sp.]
MRAISRVSINIPSCLACCLKSLRFFRLSSLIKDAFTFIVNLFFSFIFKSSLRHHCRLNNINLHQPRIHVNIYNKLFVKPAMNPRISHGGINHIIRHDRHCHSVRVNPLMRCHDVIIKNIVSMQPFIRMLCPHDKHIVTSGVERLSQCNIASDSIAFRITQHTIKLKNDTFHKISPRGFILIYAMLESTSRRIDITTSPGNHEGILIFFVGAEGEDILTRKSWCVG